jgi:hypothetical protein
MKSILFMVIFTLKLQNFEIVETFYTTGGMSRMQAFEK